MKVNLYNVKDDMMIPKIKKVNLSTQLVDTITSLIENGTWKLGDKLPNEVELATSFEVSRNIMRESMKILENFGILESKTGIGTFISQTALSAIHNMRFFDELKNNSTVDMIMETRIIIEPELSYYAALRATDEEIEILQDLFMANDKGNREKFFKEHHDFNFHLFLAKCSKNTILENLLFTILDQLKASEYLKFNQHVELEASTNSYENHKEIAAAIINKDPLLAKELMIHHLSIRMDIISSSYNIDLAMSKKIREERSEE